MTSADYLATVNSIKCSGTGITQDLIAQLYNGGRGTLVAIVELRPEVEALNKRTGQKSLTLIIDTIEPVVAKSGKIDKQLDEHVRTIQQALNYERRLAQVGADELPFDDERDGPAPKVTDILQKGKGITEDAGDGEKRIHDPDPTARPAVDREVKQVE